MSIIHSSKEVILNADDDMEILIDDLGEEKCFALSKFVIPGLDWRGTKYEI